MKKIIFIILSFIGTFLSAQQTNFFVVSEITVQPEIIHASDYTFNLRSTTNYTNIISHGLTGMGPGTYPRRIKSLVSISDDIIGNLILNASSEWVPLNAGNECSDNNDINIDFNTQNYASISGGCFGRSYVFKFSLNNPSMEDETSGNCEEINMYSPLFNNYYFNYPRPYKLHWFYKKTNSPYFVPFPEEYQVESLSFIPNDIPDLNNYVGELKIRFALVGAVSGDFITGNPDEDPIQAGYTSNPISYTITKCSPKLVGEVVVEDVICNGNNNGEATFTFDRNLLDGEYFLFNIAQWDNDQWVPLPQGSFQVNELTNNQYTVTDLGPGTYQLTYQTYDNGENTSVNISPEFTINAPPVVTFEYNFTHINCYGENDGTISLMASGGVGDYQYSIDGVNFQSSPEFINLYPGSYSLMVKDANGCLAQAGSQEVTLLEPSAPIEITLSESQNPSAYNNTDGYIEVNVTGGTPFAYPASPFNYQWFRLVQGQLLPELVSTSEDLMNVGGGTYQLVVTDSKGCTSEFILELVAPAQLILEVSQTSEINCNGDQTGALIAIVSGGVVPYNEISWSNGMVGNEISNLVAGIYTATVTDFNGIQVSTEFIIEEPEILTANYMPQNISCFGANDGSIGLNVEGGVTPYQYTWTKNGTDFSSENELTNLSIGVYQCTIVDANGCLLYLEDVEITEPSPLEISAEVTDITNVDAGNGSISLTVSGGTVSASETYIYNWSNGENTASIDNLTAGEYTVTVTDNNGCQISATYVIEDYIPITISFTQTQFILCNGDDTAAIETVIEGGTGEYTFNWTYNGEALNSNSLNLNDLAAGNYEITVTDNNGEIASASISISEPSALIANHQSQNISCFEAADASITLNVEGGVTPYQYAWTKDGVNFSSESSLSNLSPGNYQCTIVDDNGCTYTVENIEITQPSILEISAQIVNTTTVGGDNGSISLNVNGGTINNSEGYNYSWSNGANTASISNLTAGDYTVTVSDNNECEITETFTVEDYTPVTLSLSQTQFILCHGDETAVIESITQGGIGNFLYSWTLNGEPLSTNTSQLTNVGAGTYELVLTDSNGESVNASILISEPDPINATYTVENASCFESTDGAISIYPEGGIPPYTYAWLHNGTTLSTTAELIDQGVGMYDCIITDANDCVLEVSGISITEPSPLMIEGIISNTTAPEAMDGSIMIEVTGGTTENGGYSYVWSDGSTESDRTNLDVGTYTVTVSDDHNCTATASFDIIDPAVLIVNAEQTEFIYCNAAETAAIVVNTSGGIEPYYYNWTRNGETLSATTSQLNNIGAGSYVVTVSDSGTQSVSVPIEILEPTGITATYISNSVLCNGESNGSIQITPSGASGEYTYQWYSDELIGNNQNIENLAAGIYTVYIKDANNLNCPAYSLEIEVTEPTELQLDSYSQISPTGFGVENGAITIDVIGGTEPYQFSWNTGEISQNLENVGAGNYDVVITDANGCSISESFALYEPDQLLVQIEQTSEILCNGSNEAALSASGEGGIPPYSYEWNTSETETSIHELVAGEYTVTITDSNGNSANGSFEVMQPEPLSITFESVDIPCSGEEVGSLTANVTGGTPPYQYLWANNESSATISGLSVGNYPIIILDDNGCMLQSFGTVNSASDIVIESEITNPSCTNESDGSISLTISGGSGNYSISWNDDIGTGNQATQLPAGIYQAMITDIDNDCIIPWQGQLIDPEPLELDLGGDRILCIDQSTTIDGTIEGEEDADYLWVSDNGFVANTAEVSLEESGIYTLTVTTEEGCVISDDVEILQINEEISSDFLVATQAYVNDEVILINVSDDQNQEVTWLLPEEANIVSTSNYNAVIQFEQTGLYEVGMQVDNLSGCQSISYSSIVIEENPNLPDNENSDEPYVQEFIIYPNPTQSQGEFTVKAVLSEPAEINITIYQVGTGSFINQSYFEEAEIHEHTFDLNIQTGAYWVILHTPRMVLSKKLIVIN